MQRIGVGRYIVYFSSAQPNANYAVTANCSYLVGSVCSDIVLHSYFDGSYYAPTTTGFYISTGSSGVGVSDGALISVVVMGY